MNQQRIVLSGATGNLGGRIARELRQRGASVCAIVRPRTGAGKLAPLQQQGVEIVEADLHARAEVVQACQGASCVVSALLGLEETLLNAQGALLDAAIEAGVPRFIPSDYAMDFTKIQAGLNRNFDVHRRFRDRLDRAPVRSTSVLNGAFINLLTGEAPLVLFKIKRVLYWGENAEQKLDFTTMDDTAAYTAEVALDPGAPRLLRIAGEQISAAGLARAASKVSGPGLSVSCAVAAWAAYKASSRSLERSRQSRTPRFPCGRACSTSTACLRGAGCSNRSTTDAIRICAGLV